MQRFVDTRARAEKLSDGSQLFGWVLAIKDSEIMIRVTLSEQLMPEDVCMIFLSSPRGDSSFKAAVKYRKDSDVCFLMPAEVQIQTPQAGMRVMLESMLGTVIVDGRSMEVEAIDASESAIGLVCPEHLDPGTRIEVQIETPRGKIASTGKVIACTPCRAESGPYALEGEDRFRVGVMLDKLDRIDQARWNQLLNRQVA